MTGTNHRRRVGGLFALLAGLLVLSWGGALRALAQDATPDDAARFLAGLQPSAGSLAATWGRDPSWQHHRAQFDRSWQELEARQLSRIRPWAEANLTTRRATLFYMFSGPDFLYANAFFPHATTYVLAGLEPPGNIPQFTEAFRRAMPGSLGGLRHSLATVMSYSFFRTKDMKTTLSGYVLNGTLPPLFVFLARAGKTIHEVNLIELHPNGELVRRGRDLARGIAPGVEITFSTPDAAGKPGPMQTLYYFKTDLSDSGIRTSGLIEFMRRLGRGDALVKSASYLMHSGNFSTIRQFLLDQSDAIVQDDSGIPVHYFRPQEFELRPYGRYLGPIEEFPSRYQPRLADVFRRSPPRIDFGIGYRWRPHESNLLVAVRRPEGAEISVASAEAEQRPETARAAAPPRERSRSTPRPRPRQQPTWQIFPWLWD